MLQALSYALFGSAINTIKKDNLINRTNEKNMAVTVEFSVRGIDYKIIRGRKPNILKFFVNNTEQATTDDDSQGENRQTQEAIEKVLCMTSTMFQHIVGLNSYTTPFLSMKVGEQREVIEQLLGITLLSEKAEAIKELNKRTKEEIQREEYRIKGIDESNRRIQEQIDSLKRRQGLWKKKYDSDLAFLVDNYDSLIKVDIEAELLAHKDLAIWNEKKRQNDVFQSIVSRQVSWKNKNSAELLELESALKEKSHIDIEAELKAHSDLSIWTVKSANMTQLQKLIDRCVTDEKKEQKVLDKLKAEVEELKNHKCYACGQDFHDDNHEAVLSAKEKALREAALQVLATNSQWLEHTDELRKHGEIGSRPVTFYQSEAEAVRHGSDIENIVKQIEAKRMEIDPYAEQLSELVELELGAKPTTLYKTEQEAISHKTKVNSFEQQITAKTQEADPYSEQITEMESSAIQEINYSIIESLNKVLKHQDYLLDLLTNKKSFVRKKIIEQNLGYLNARLTHYLDRIGLPHRVVFQNDLSVEITELGRDLDFHNLSRGEMNRVILALSFAFRDVFENLFTPVNLLFIDELVDNGMDAVGLDNALGILKDFVRKRNKSVWMVSHKDELLSRVDSVLHVVKENGYTSYRMGDEE
jgi:DNA repair exonuclease SbcCD ATPase subunit